MGGATGSGLFCGRIHAPGRHGSADGGTRGEAEEARSAPLSS